MSFKTKGPIMRIQLNEEEITRGVIAFLTEQGVEINGEVSVDFSMKRSPSALQAEVVINEVASLAQEEVPAIESNPESDIVVEDDDEDSTDLFD
jgi:hypothetical protein